MIGSNGGYYADKPVVYMTKTESDGTEKTIKLENVFTTSFRKIAISSADVSEAFRRFDNEFRKHLHETTDCSGTLVWYDKNVFNDETRAKVMGFKNANCLSRHIRRMKRKKEQERRRRLKSGTG